ncbi:hypothetical protein [Agromyces sp. NPDC056965]|uniref:hypothetical protein n=1 Tax=Agromyces sp. NPDC056965 TaxID=3345983 RepID=UPI00362B4DCA
MADDDEQLEARAIALRRVVYGTPEGYASDASAELAAVEQELARRRAALGTAPAGEASGEASAGLPDTDGPERSAAANPAPGRRPTGRLATVAAFLAVLAVAAGLGAGAAIGLAQTPVGLAVFDRPQRASDESLTVALGVQADSVRNVGELFGRGFWAFRNGDDRVCLSVVPLGTGTVERGECASTARFAEHGISVQYSMAELGVHRPGGARDTDLVQVTWSPTAAELEWVLLAVAP